MPSSRIPLGPFDLLEVIGKGGAATVWRGLHRDQGVPVAVKVLTRAKRPNSAEAFRREVRSVAGLSHPGIVTVFDHGRIDGVAAGMSEELVEGRPFLVMELAAGGALKRRRHPRRYASLRALLLQLLDALAHAHARGVVHRDLKPNNILACTGRGGRTVWKLTDFGIAHAIEETPVLRGAAGTPAFMAPEQILGQVRDQGPWTDLYALGIVAWELATGRLPYAFQDVKQVLKAHLRRAPPTFRPAFAVPYGFEWWLSRLLHKVPSRRFQLAADAAYALLTLGDSESEAEDGTQPLPAVAATTLNSMITETVDTVVDQTAPPVENVLPRKATLTAPYEIAPPMPGTWRRPEGPRPSGRLIGAGLGLFGLRAIPLVGREQELDTLWRALAEVRASGEARLIILRGRAGVGKSQLARWVAERALELGCAEILKATHSPMGGPAHGLRRLVAHALGCVGLTGPAVFDRVHHVLTDGGLQEEETDVFDARALAEVIEPTGKGSTRERYLALRRFIARRSRRRPIIVWLDDVQWGRDAIAFAADLARSQSRHPARALVILTAQDEALAERHDEQARLRDLASLGRVREMEVPPLSRSEHRSLVERLLGLEADLVEEVALRTSGNPLFAVQLVGDWVQHGVLEPGPNGFCLSGAREAWLPRDIYDLWRARLERLLEDVEGNRRDAARAGLEIAAALGQRVDNDEWLRACAQAGLDSDREQQELVELVDAMEARRLAVRDRLGWGFVHSMLRETLERHARVSDRLASHHRACARMLEDFIEREAFGYSGRHGRHLLLAGDVEAALPALLRGAHEHRLSTDIAESHDLLDEYEAGLTRLGVSANDRRRAEAYLSRAQTYIIRMQHQEALGWTSQADQIARKGGHEELLADALYVRAMIAQQQAEVSEGMAHCDEALPLYDKVGSPNGRGRVLCVRGMLVAQGGDMTSARGHFEEAVAIFRADGDVEELARALVGLAEMVLRLGDRTLYERYMNEARQLMSRMGDHLGVAKVVNGLGELARSRGDLDEAERCYLEAIEIFDAAESDQRGCVPRLNLALVQLTRGLYPLAWDALERVRELLEDSGRRGYLGIVLALELPCIAARADWPAMARHVRRTHEILAETGFVDPDVAWSVELAADLARERGGGREAALAYHIADTQYRALGDEERADRAAALAATLTRQRPGDDALTTG